MVFSGPDNPQNCPFREYLDLITYNTWFLGPPESASQTAVQPFLQAHLFDEHTDRETDNITCDSCSSRPHRA